MNVMRRGRLIDVLETDAPDPEAAEQDIRAIAKSEHGDDIELSNLMRKGATGV